MILLGVVSVDATGLTKNPVFPAFSAASDALRIIEYAG